MFRVHQNLIGGPPRQIPSIVLGNNAELGAIAFIRWCRHKWKRIRIVVACLRVVAGLGFVVIAQAIAIDVRCAVTATHPNGIELVAITVAVAFRNVFTSAIVHGAGTITNAAGIECTDAIVLIVANAISVDVGRAISSAHSEGVELIAIAVAIAIWDVIAAAVARSTGTVADSALIDHANAVVLVVTNAIGIGIRRAVPTTLSKCVELVAIAVTVAVRNGITTTLKDRSRTIADSTIVIGAHAIVLIVTDAVLISICRAVTATDTERVIIHAIVVSVGRASCVKADREVQQQEILVVSLWEQLHLNVTAQDPIGGELAKQDATIRIGHPVGITGKDVPPPAHFVVHDDVASSRSKTGIKRQGPTLVR